MQFLFSLHVYIRSIYFIDLPVLLESSEIDDITKCNGKRYTFSSLFEFIYLSISERY